MPVHDLKLPASNPIPRGSNVVPFWLWLLFFLRIMIYCPEGTTFEPLGKLWTWYALTQRACESSPRLRRYLGPRFLRRRQQQHPVLGDSLASAPPTSTFGAPLPGDSRCSPSQNGPSYICGLPTPHNCPLRNPKYHLMETTRPLIEVH